MDPSAEQTVLLTRTLDGFVKDSKARLQTAIIEAGNRSERLLDLHAKDTVKTAMRFLEDASKNVDHAIAVLAHVNNLAPRLFGPNGYLPTGHPHTLIVVLEGMGGTHEQLFVIDGPEGDRIRQARYAASRRRRGVTEEAVDFEDSTNINLSSDSVAEIPAGHMVRVRKLTTGAANNAHARITAMFEDAHFRWTAAGKVATAFIVTHFGAKIRYTSDSILDNKLYLSLFTTVVDDVYNPIRTVSARSVLRRYFTVAKSSAVGMRDNRYILAFILTGGTQVVCRIGIRFINEPRTQFPVTVMLTDKMDPIDIEYKKVANAKSKQESQLWSRLLINDRQGVSLANILGRNVIFTSPTPIERVFIHKKGIAQHFSVPITPRRRLCVDGINLCMHTKEKTCEVQHYLTRPFCTSGTADA